MNAFYQAAGQLSREMQDRLFRVKPNQAASIQEIRLRSGRPVALSAPDGNYMLTVSGELTKEDQSLVWVDQNNWKPALWRSAATLYMLTKTISSRVF